MIGLEDRRMKVRSIEAAQQGGARFDAACKVAGITAAYIAAFET